MKRQWRYVDKNIHYYFQTNDGQVIGKAYNVALTIIWGAKIPINATEELIIGEFVELEYAKLAIERYWNEKDRTFDMFDDVYKLPAGIVDEPAGKSF
jgi:hypothetical protein